MVFVSLLFWGPLPLAWLWVGSQVKYVDGQRRPRRIVVAFVGLLLDACCSGSSCCKRLDHAWILVRRAAGHDQREGVIGRVFAVTAVDRRDRSSRSGCFVIGAASRLGAAARRG